METCFSRVPGGIGSSPAALPAPGSLQPCDPSSADGQRLPEHQLMLHDVVKVTSGEAGMQPQTEDSAMGNWGEKGQNGQSAGRRGSSPTASPAPLSLPGRAGGTSDSSPRLAHLPHQSLPTGFVSPAQPQPGPLPPSP